MECRLSVHFNRLQPRRTSPMNRLCDRFMIIDHMGLSIVVGMDNAHVTRCLQPSPNGGVDAFHRQIDRLERGLDVDARFRRKCIWPAR
jgi:hypothetical protein